MFDFAIYTLIACNILVFALFSYTRARLDKLERALGHLDWEALAGLVGDVAVLKRTIQKLNMRMIVTGKQRKNEDIARN